MAVIDETDADLTPIAAGADLVIRGSSIDDAILFELIVYAAEFRPALPCHWRSICTVGRTGSWN